MIDIEQPIITVEPVAPLILAVTIGSTDEIAISVPTAAAEIIVAGIQGPEGIPGVSAGAVSLTANTALGGHRAVIADNGGVAYADSTNAAHAGRIVGVTLGAAAQGALVPIVSSGEIIEPSWSWLVDGPIYVGGNGLLTQTPPTTGFVQSIGVALSATKMMVAIGDPTILIGA